MSGRFSERQQIETNLQKDVDGSGSREAHIVVGGDRSSRPQVSIKRCRVDAGWPFRAATNKTNSDGLEGHPANSLTGLTNKIL